MVSAEGSSGFLYPDGRSHVVRADFCKVSAHDAVVETIKQHDDAHVHGVLRLDPAQANKREQREMFENRVKTHISLFTCIFFIQNNIIIFVQIIIKENKQSKVLLKGFVSISCSF